MAAVLVAVLSGTAAAQPTPRAVRHTDVAARVAMPATEVAPTTVQPAVRRGDVARRVAPREAAAREAQPARIRFHDVRAEALEIRATGASRPTATEVPGGAEVPVQVGEQVIVQPRRPDVPTATRVVEDAGKQSLPAAILIGRRNPRTGRATVSRLQPFLQAEMIPLRWDPREKSYVTTLVAGIDSIGGDADTRLIEPVTFQTLRVEIDRIDHDTLTVRKAGPDGYVRTRIFAQRYVPAVEVGIHSPVGDMTLRARVDPGLALQIVASDHSVPAFGLGSTVVTLLRRASDGSELAAESELRIPAMTSLGRLDPREFTLKRGETSARATLTSSSIGVASITLPGVSTGVSELHVPLVWPWFLMAAGLIGAVVGAGVRALRKRSDRTWAMLAGSIVTGLVADLLLSLGVPLVVDIAPVIMTTEAGWFVFGVLAGILGTPLLVQLARSMLGAKSAPLGQQGDVGASSQT